MSTNPSTTYLALRRWHAAPLLRASLAWHCAAAVLTLLRPHWWPWTLSALIANHLALMALGLWPRSRALGSNWTRLPARAAARGEVAITIDDGPDPEITPQVLSILAEHRARADWLPLGIQRGSSREGGLDFAWREEVIATPNPAFRRLDISVSAVAEEARPLAHYTGFVVNPPGSGK